MEQHIADYLIPLFSAKRKILAISLLCAVIFYGLSYLLPVYYEAKTSVLPANFGAEELRGGSLETLLPVLGVAPGENKADVFIQILRSRTVGEKILERLHLREKWNIDSVEKALKKLHSRTSMVATREGMLLLSFEARTPQLAADVANAYIEELDRVNQENNSSRARNARIYIETQLKKTDEELRKATRKLAQFQLKHKTIALQDQLKAAIEQASTLKAQIIAKQVQMGVLKQTVKESNPRYRELQTELQELQRQYDKIQFGGDKPLQEREEFFIAFDEVPQVSLELADLYRDVKIKESVFELLNQQYYQAKVEEARDTPTIQVLDRAKPPERKSRPFRMLIAATGFLLGLITSISRIAFRQYSISLQKQDPDEYSRWREVKKAMRITWTHPGFSKKKNR